MDQGSKVNREDRSSCGTTALSPSALIVWFAPSGMIFRIANKLRAIPHGETMRVAGTGSEDDDLRDCPGKQVILDLTFGIRSAFSSGDHIQRAIEDSAPMVARDTFRQLKGNHEVDCPMFGINSQDRLFTLRCDPQTSVEPCCTVAASTMARRA